MSQHALHRRTIRLTLMATIGVVGLAVIQGPASAIAAVPALSLERVVVVLNPVEALRAVEIQDVLVQRHQMQPLQRFSYALQGFAATMPTDQIAALKGEASVAGVYPDAVMTVTSEVKKNIRRVGADTVEGTTIGTGGFVDADIAIMDTGVNAHPDLNLVGGVDCSDDNGCLEGGSYGDGYGHGTHVAGIAAAKDNGDGVVGVAPGARVWSVKVFNDDGYGQFSWVIAAFDWVVAQGDIEVVNASFGGAGRIEDAISLAIDQATATGVVVVAGAGNEGANVRRFTPANAPNAITVSGYVDTDGVGGGEGGECEGDGDDTLLSYSNFGRLVDVAAPGGCVRSTYGTTRYVSLSGTSMAAPHVAGAAAVYITLFDVPADGDRATTVSQALKGVWGASQTGECGFTEGRSHEPVLFMGDCPS